MNRVFFTGRLRTKPEVVYTPSGGKYILFPLWVEEGDFRIDVECAGEKGLHDWNARIGKELMVSGSLIKAKVKAQEVFKLKAKKIYWMEE